MAVRLRREGWKVETYRKRKQVNHGTWRKYTAELVDPQQQVQLQVTRIRGEQGKVSLDVVLEAAIAIDARQAKWARGVQLYSLSVQGQARVRLHLELELDLDFRLSNSPPQVRAAPGSPQCQTGTA